MDVILQGRLTGDEKVQVKLIDLQSNLPVREKVITFQSEEVQILDQEIGQWVAQMLGRDPGTIVQSESDQRYHNNPEADRLYRLGKTEYTKYTRESMNRAIDYLKKAIEIDETFALAHATLANVYATEGMDLYPPKEMFELARPHANRAFELDATLAEAHAALAAIAFFYDRDWAKWEDYLEHARSLDSMSIEIHACLMHGRDASNPTEALPHVKSLLISNPLSLVVKTEVGCASYYAGEFAGSIEQLFAWNDENGPAKELEPRIASIDVVGTVATVRLELDNWTGYRFTDLFTLLKVDGDWKIMNKVFHLHP